MSDRLTEGTIVDGRYRVLGRLGAGGMADVYCAEDLQLGRRIALKILYRRFAEDEEFVERFRREASSAAGLQHPHVVAVYDRGEYDGTSYIAMEYVDGRTLKAIVDERGPLPPAEAIDLIVQVLRAARFAHKRGVIHRDLKPHNVIVDAEGRAKVTDFGIARAGASDMTETGSIMGTAQYLSPEQAQGLPVSAQSDIYSIGITLYELLAGKVPFDGESAVAIALKQVNEVPVPPSRLNPAVTGQLDAIVLRALDKDPARRFPDADAFIAALEEARLALPDQTRIGGAGLAAAGATAATVLAGPPTEAIPVVPPVTGEYYPATPLPPPDPRRGTGRWWIALLIGLLVAGAVVAALLLTGGKKVTVPSVVGATQATAEVKLGDAGLSTKSVTKTSDRPQGIVIGQQPQGGAEVDEHSTVTLVVSSGPGEGTIPQVAGLGRKTARKKLVEAGFAVEEQERNDDTVAKNHVIETSPAAGERLEKGQTVTLIVSLGPESVTMPAVVGQARDDAVSTLEDAGFDVAIKEQESDQDPGTVLAQDPAANATVPKGSKVTLTVAKAPTTVELPDVSGKTEDDAIQALSSAGFTIKRKQQDVDTPDQDGLVLSQSPAGGKKVKKGTTVTITVGRFNPALNPEGGGGTTTTPSTTPTTPTGTP